MTGIAARPWPGAVLCGLAVAGAPCARAAEQTFQCKDLGGQTATRVVGGHDAQPHDAPWQVAIYLGREFQCGGSLIAGAWVLTAAHCVSATQAALLSVAHGSQQMDQGSRSAVSEVIQHPRWKGTAEDGGDIALLHLSRPFEVAGGDLIHLQNPAIRRLFTAPGTCALVTGWGRLHEAQEQLPAHLQAAYLPLAASASCRRALRAALRGVEAPEGEYVCAGYGTGGIDACQGDSGGPLVVEGGPTRWTQVGIVSFGAGCARPGSYGAYTLVAPYYNWIDRTLAEHRP